MQKPQEEAWGRAAVFSSLQAAKPAVSHEWALDNRGKLARWMLIPVH
jgi:hypothetical protein